ncbi:MAG: HD domain-containing protein, partial [Desulfobulbaceae bacterium]|nr:HD domain-containing protein [Desulfobulbaceae bacterium]
CRDLDIAAAVDGVACARFLAAHLQGAFVPLDEEQGVARVIWQGYEIDFSRFRDGTETIEADLARRDFTINSLGVAVDAQRGGLQPPYAIIDPLGGMDDLVQGLVRACGDFVFRADPLRLLRAYRFVSCLGLQLEVSTADRIAAEAFLLAGTAMERVAGELDLIMASDRASEGVAMMAANGLLWGIFPELRAGDGMAQPASHHLDVFSHNLEALRRMEELLADPGHWFPDHGQQFADHLAHNGKRGRWLKWAALFHDIAKPACRRLRDGRVTFYNHDLTGGLFFAEIARRLRWSRTDAKQVCRLIELHMWPFHLCNARRRTEITPRACLRLVKAAGHELPGLFLLAMADSLAGAGPDKPEGMEAELAALYAQVDAVYQRSIRPVLEHPRLLSGHDLIRDFGLPSGKIIGEILQELEAAQVAGEIGSRSDAEGWVRCFLDNRK